MAHGKTGSYNLSGSFSGLNSDAVTITVTFDPPNGMIISNTGYILQVQSTSVQDTGTYNVSFEASIEGIKYYDIFDFTVTNSQP